MSFCRLSWELLTIISILNIFFLLFSFDTAGHGDDSGVDNFGVNDSGIDNLGVDDLGVPFRHE